MQATAKPRIAATDADVQRFLTLWHETGRVQFERSYPSLDYDSPAYSCHARQRRKYIALDRGTSGAYLLDRATTVVYPIKSAYGVANKARPLGTLAEIIANWFARPLGYRGFP